MDLTGCARAGDVAGGRAASSPPSSCCQRLRHRVPSQVGGLSWLETGMHDGDWEHITARQVGGRRGGLGCGFVASASNARALSTRQPCPPHPTPTHTSQGAPHHWRAAWDVVQRASLAGWVVGGGRQRGSRPCQRAAHRVRGAAWARHLPPPRHHPPPLFPGQRQDQRGGPGLAPPTRRATAPAPAASEAARGRGGARARRRARV